MHLHNIIRKLVPGGIRRTLKDVMGISVLQERIARLEAAFCEIEEEVKGSRFTLGYFDSMQHKENNLIISGWMLNLKKPVELFALYVDGSKVGESPARERKGVAKNYRFIPHALKSGFWFAAPIESVEEERMTDIRVAGVSNGKEICRLETWYHKDMYSAPAPPANLMLRQNNYEDVNFHYALGLQSYRQFWTAVCRNKEPSSIQRMLDWGCGCGRVLWFFLKFSDFTEICGCDIDAEAINWCRENLAPAEFQVIPLYPPTSYPDNQFDLIVSFSVLTHLSREVQLSWLKEMNRILAPEGLFLTTVHGELATRFCFPPNEAEEVIRKQFYDVSDGKLDGIAPTNYYRGAFQTREYSEKEYMRYFHILEYLPGGATGYQDLIVMKKKGGEKLRLPETT